MTIVVSKAFPFSDEFHPILKTCCNAVMIKTVIIIFDQVLIELSYNKRTSVFGVEAKFSRRQIACSHYAKGSPL